MRNAVWVVCNGKAHGVASESLELIGKARQLADSLQRKLVALATSSQGAKPELFHAGADVTVGVATDSAVWQDDSAAGTVIAQVLEQIEPEIVLVAADVWGRAGAPWVAATLKTGLTADCTALTIDKNGLLLQSRPARSGSLLADIICHTKPQMATVRPRIFPLPDMDDTRRGEIIKVYVEAPPIRLRRVSVQEVRDKTSLHDAEIIVAGGKGVGSREGFQKLHELADLLGGTVGATRGAVDAGYVGYDRQIGQTGIVVRPRVYLAFGISGLVQHVVGIFGAKYIVAVNIDERAPIFDHCDYGIVADWQVVADRLIEELRKEKKA